MLGRWWDWSHGDEPTIHDARRVLGIATEDDEPDDELVGPPPEPMPVTSFDCFLMGHHNQYADHQAEDCDRDKHVIPVPSAFVHLTIKDCE